MTASNPQSDILTDAIFESRANWKVDPNGPELANVANTAPLMIKAMNRGLDKYPDVEAKIRNANKNPLDKEEYTAALKLYADKLEAFYEACGEYPTSMLLPKPKNNCERYVWTLVEAFLEYKNGKKPTLKEAA
jgi:hypothetical protein